MPRDVLLALAGKEGRERLRYSWLGGKGEVLVGDGVSKAGDPSYRARGVAGPLPTPLCRRSASTSCGGATSTVPFPTTPTEVRRTSCSVVSAGGAGMCMLRPLWNVPLLSLLVASVSCNRSTSSLTTSASVVCSAGLMAACGAATGLDDAELDGTRPWPSLAEGDRRGGTGPSTGMLGVVAVIGDVFGGLKNRSLSSINPGVPGSLL